MSAAENVSQDDPNLFNAATDPDMADALVDEVMPEGFDWRRMVQTYPWPSLTLAAMGGWMLAHRRGAGVLTSLAAFATDQIISQVNQLLDEEVL